MNDLLEVEPPSLSELLQARPGRRAICPLCSEPQGWPYDAFVHLEKAHKRTREEALTTLGMKEGDNWPAHLYEGGQQPPVAEPHSKPICAADCYYEYSRNCVDCGHPAECRGERQCIREITTAQVADADADILRTLKRPGAIVRAWPYPPTGAIQQSPDDKLLRSKDLTKVWQQPCKQPRTGEKAGVCATCGNSLDEHRVKDFDNQTLTAMLRYQELEDELLALAGKPHTIGQRWDGKQWEPVETAATPLIYKSHFFDCAGWEPGGECYCDTRKIESCAESSPGATLMRSLSRRIWSLESDVPLSPERIRADNSAAALHTKNDTDYKVGDRVWAPHPSWDDTKDHVQGVIKAIRGRRIIVKLDLKDDLGHPIETTYSEGHLDLVEEVTGSK